MINQSEVNRLNAVLGENKIHKRCKYIIYEEALRLTTVSFEDDSFLTITESDLTEYHLENDFTHKYSIDIVDFVVQKIKDQIKGLTDKIK